MSKAKSRNVGFTLIELLLVMAIVSLLVCISLPAVQSSRESARRLQCSNNLRQFAVAMTNTEAQRGAFPASVSAQFKGPFGTDPGFVSHSFMVELLPFLEETSIASLYHQDETFLAAANATAIASPIAVALCPSAPEREPAPKGSYVPSLMIRPSTQKKSGLTKAILDALDSKYSGSFFAAVTDYSVPAHADRKLAISLGYPMDLDSVRELPSMFPVPDSNTLLKGLTPLLIGSGTFTIGEHMRASQVTDGLSHTFTLTEVAGRPQHWLQGERNPLQEPLSAAWSDPRIIIKVKKSPTQSGSGVMNVDNNSQIYSFHIGGANFAFADGHVAYMEENMEPRLLLALMTPNRGDDANSGQTAQ